MSQSRSNQGKAPICAEFVESLRKVFGADQVKVLCVREAGVELGEEQESIQEYVDRETAKVYARD